MGRRGAPLPALLLLLAHRCALAAEAGGPEGAAPTAGAAAPDAVHITAILGESVVFNCHVEFPEGQPVPYVLQWEKKMARRRALIEYFLKGQDIPIYIWYESYPTHSGEGYEGRVSRVAPDSPYGAASLNLTDIRETDQGWYECKVVFLNRAPGQKGRNGTWFHLEVHAPPRFISTPERYVYVNLGDAVILSCQAEGAPAPEIVWYKDDAAVQPSSSIGVFNDGTELRIANIRAADVGDYTCIARNGEGQVTHTAELVAAGPAVITVPPANQTRLEGDKAEFQCEAKGQPGNITVRWFREGAPVRELAQLESRVAVRRDGALVVNPVAADDAGQYLCEVSNGIGEPQSASAYLNVEYPAKVTFTPTIQYLPFRLAGVVQCHIKANPPLQYVTWTKDKRLLEPYQTKDIIIMNNGSLLFTRVNEGHAGRYTCTPYNAQGTQGSSGQMEVLVRKPPVFTVEPEAMYQRKVGDSVEMHCDAQEAEGTQRPTISWQRRDGTPLPKGRSRVAGGNITIEGLRRADFGFYQCVATNEVATIAALSQLVVEGTQPHAPYNLTVTPGEFSVTLSWLPGYSGGPDYRQDYTIWYREAGGVADWATIPVTPPGSTRVTIGRLAPATTYEFQVVGKNALGDGMMSQVVSARTLDVGLQHVVAVTAAPPPRGANPAAGTEDSGPKPGAPRNLTVTEVNNGFLITWQAPAERAGLVRHYDIKYRTDGPYKVLNKAPIRPEDTQFLVKNLVGGRTYYFQILAVSEDGTSLGPDDAVKFSVPARVKHKAITAGVVGGILFFIVAIILSVCAVKICNKRKRRKQEKAYNMVACRITDARNGAGAADSQVPLKKCRTGGVPGVIGSRWAWARVRRRRPSVLGSPGPTLARIERASDGRFVVGRPGSAPSPSTSSVSTDDGGFLAPRLVMPAALMPAPPPPPPRSSSPGWPPPLFADLSSVHLRYSRELPSLRVLQAAARVRPRPSADPLDRSPESRSSSSGFGSKNTSSQPPTTLPGSAADWRPPPPPYRAPPPPVSFWPPSPPPLKLSQDAGSVDGHYEFDGGSRTPTPAPSAEGDTRRMMARRPDDIDARVRAMKEEFHEFRKRQASRRGGAVGMPPPLESAC